MQRRRVFFMVSATLCLAALCSTLAKAQGPLAISSKNPFVGNTAAIAEGKMVFEAVCAGYCHATEGAQREGKCPNLFDCDWKHGSSDDEVFHAVINGVPNTEMVGFKGKLPDEMLWKVIAYMRSASQCQSGKPPAAVAH